MKIKKIVTLITCLVLGISCFACNGVGDGGGPLAPSNDSKTVDVLIAKDAYGTDFLTIVADAFNELYEEEGYFVNILTPREGFGTASALSEMRLGNATGYDIVFPGSVFIYDVINETYGNCVEEITDVWYSTAINFDGTESEETIDELYKNDTIEDISVYDSEGNRHVYGFPMTSSVHGMVVNKPLYEDLTGELWEESMPKTSDELFKVINLVMALNDAGETNAYPISYSGQRATFSWQTYLTAERQILGEEEHYERWTWDKYYTENGNSIPLNDYTHITKAYYRQPVMEWVLNMWDHMLANRGADQIKHRIAQGQILVGDAMFAFEGEYFYNQVRYDFYPELDDVVMMQFPMHSFVGLKYDLCGAGHNVTVYGNNYNAHCAECDEILSAFCWSWDALASEHGGYGVDMNTVIQEVANKTGVTLTEEQYLALEDARGFIYGMYAPMYVTIDCGVEDIAGLYLRMLASKDAADVRSEYGMLHPYYDNEVPEDAHQFVKDCARLERICRSRATGNYMGRHGSPQNIAGIGNYGTYGPTMGVTCHDFIGTEAHYTDRDYPKLAKALLESDKCDGNIKNNWNEKAESVPNNVFIPDYD